MIGRALALAMALVLAPGVAQAQSDRAAAEAQARRATERMRALQQEADQLAAEARTLLVDLRRLELERQIRAEEARQAEASLAALRDELAATGARLEQLERQELAGRPELAARMVDIYKRGQGGYLRLLLGVGDLRSFGRAYRTVSAIAALDEARIAGHRTSLSDLQETRTRLQTRLAEQTAVEERARRATQAAEQAVTARTRLIASIDARRDLNAQLAGELQSAQQRLQQTLAGLSRGAPASADAVALPLRSFRGGLDWPVTGAVLTRFGRSTTPRFRTAIVRNGIEIRAADRQAAGAVHEGTVAFAAPFTGFGQVVILDHGAQAYSLYGYLSEVAVTKGDRVGRGQALGRIGASPTGVAAMYFELRIDGKPVDPLEWLKKP